MLAMGWGVRMHPQILFEPASALVYPLPDFFGHTFGCVNALVTVVFFLGAIVITSAACQSEEQGQSNQKSHACAHGVLFLLSQPC